MNRAFLERCNEVEATFEMSFRDSDTDAIVTLPSFYFSFFDLECARNE